MANNLVGQFNAALGAMYGAILPLAQNLFIYLAVITLLVYLIWALLEKDDPVPLMVGALKNLMRISFFWFVLINANTLSTALIQSFRIAGQTAAAAAGAPIASLDPTAVIATGGSLAVDLMSNINTSGILATLSGGFLGAILGSVMFLAFLFIAAQMAIALIEALITMSAGVLLLGFLGSPWTARFGMTFFAALVGSGVKLFLIYVIAGLGSGLAAGWSTFILAGVTLNGAFTVLGVALIFALSVWWIPNYAQALSSGAVSTSLGGVVTAAAGIGLAVTPFAAASGRALAGAGAIGQGAALARHGIQGGQGSVRAVAGAARQTVASPFKAAYHNATHARYQQKTAADVLRDKRAAS